MRWNEIQITGSSYASFSNPLGHVAKPRDGTASNITRHATASTPRTVNVVALAHTAVMQASSSSKHTATGPRNVHRQPCRYPSLFHDRHLSRDDYHDAIFVQITIPSTTGGHEEHDLIMPMIAKALSLGPIVTPNNRYHLFYCILSTRLGRG